MVVLAALFTVTFLFQAQPQDKEETEKPKLIWTVDGLPSTSLASAAVGDITGDDKDGDFLRGGEPRPPEKESCRNLRESLLP